MKTQGQAERSATASNFVRITRRLLALMLALGMCLAFCASAAAVYDENLSAYQDKSWVKEYAANKEPISIKNFRGNEDKKTKDAAVDRWIKCYDRLDALGYGMGGTRSQWIEGSLVVNAFSLFAQQAGLGDVTLTATEIPLVIEAVLMSEEAQPAIVKAVKTGDYKEKSAKDFTNLQDKKSISVRGKVVSCEKDENGNVKYTISVGEIPICVLYQAPKRSTMFIEGDAVTVFGDFYREHDKLCVRATLVAYTNIED